jgi:hypothetical protein
VVYSKSCLSHTDDVVTYLARYSHRIAISDGRIVSIEGDQVRFRYKDYADKNREKVLPLSGEEFIRRFLLHILPKGLRRIRHFGFLANRCRQAKLAQIRTALAQGDQQTDCAETADEAAGGFDGYPCPRVRHRSITPRRLIGATTLRRGIMPNR